MDMQLIADGAPIGAEVLTVLGPVILPLVTAAMLRPEWSNNIKRAFALAMAAGASVLFVVAQGVNPFMYESFDLLVTNLFFTWVVAQSAFQHLWKETPVLTALNGRDEQESVDYEPIPKHSVEPIGK